MRRMWEECFWWFVVCSLFSHSRHLTLTLDYFLQKEGPCPGTITSKLSWSSLPCRTYIFFLFAKHV
uniref:Secreted protein n=1 Tax=Anguilla anguilla TaxID=7936 RepID=A0A0E9X3W9_ANGAN